MKRLKMVLTGVALWALLTVGMAVWVSSTLVRSVVTILQIL
jgi:hypothetical protein